MAEEGEVTEELLDAEADAGADAETEASARAMNWVPLEEFKGKPEHWKPAKEFIEFSQTLNPILRQNNKELLRKNAELAQQLQSVSAKQVEQDKILRALETAASADAETSLESRAESLRAKLKDANAEQDFEAVTALQEELLEIKVEQKELKNKPKAGSDNRQTNNDGMTAAQRTEFADWKEANPWVEDPVMAAAATAIGEQIIREALTAGQPIPKGRSHLDEVTKRMDNKFNVSKTPKGDKVGSSSTSGSSGSSSAAGSEYAKLPADAKRICESQSKKFVGEGKRFTKLADWQREFAKAYNED